MRIDTRKLAYFALIALILMLPFERVPSLEVVGLTLRFNQLAAAILIAGTFLPVIRRQQSVRPFPFRWAVLAFLLFALLTVPFALNETRAALVFVFVAFMVATALAIPQVVVEKKLLASILRALLGVSALVSLFAFFQFIGNMVGWPDSVTLLKIGYGKEIFGFPRIHAFSHEPLYLANLLFVPIGVLTGLLVTRETLLPRRPLIGLLTLLLAVFLLTLSRGAFIAMVPFAVAVAFLFRRQLNRRNLATLSLAIILSLSLVWMMLRVVGGPAAPRRFIEHATLKDVLVEKQGESGFGRLSAFEQAITLWRSSPIIGVGLGNFGPAVADDPQVKPATGWEIVNNQYLELLAETGVIGFILLLIFWVGLVVRSVKAFFRANDPLIKATLGGLTAAFIAILIQYNFFSTLYIIHIWVAIGLIVALQNIALIRTQK